MNRPFRPVVVGILVALAALTAGCTGDADTGNSTTSASPSPSQATARTPNSAPLVMSPNELFGTDEKPRSVTGEFALSDAGCLTFGNVPLIGPPESTVGVDGDIVLTGFPSYRVGETTALRVSDVMTSSADEGGFHNASVCLPEHESRTYYLATPR